MKASLRVISFSFLTAVCASTAVAQAPNQGQPQGAAQNPWAAPPTVGTVSTTPSACGNQPLCYDTPDFAVAVVDFRMSIANATKVMDATLRFLNKTGQPLILGYLDGSAVALDDQGNRYGTYYNKGLAGIGLVVGNSMDPKFTIQPGGAGDARFELYWRPGAQDPIGSTFEVGMTIREINTLVGGQHTLGGEFPLRFQGLANGMNGAAPSAVAAGGGNANQILAGTGVAGQPVCGSTGSTGNAISAIAGAANSVGSQQATNATTTATNTANSAASQLSSLRSLFGKKKAAATTVAGAAPCVPAPANTTMPAIAGTSTAPAVAAPTTNAPAATAVQTNGQTAASTPATATSSSPTAIKAGAPRGGSKPAVTPNAPANATTNVQPATAPNTANPTPAAGNAAGAAPANGKSAAKPANKKQTPPPATEQKKPVNQ